MPKDVAAVLIITCVLLCLTFNCTFPLHRETGKWILKGDENSSHTCDSRDAHQKNLTDRTKKMAANIENVLRRIKDTTQDFGKSIYGHINIGVKNIADKNTLSEEDLRHFEKLVIMKKYPYLDLKELELKYSPSKHARQSMASDESNLCETAEDNPNVEISNRGLSGFAIPPQLAKHVTLPELNTKLNKDNKVPEGINNIEIHFSKKPTDRIMLASLKDDIKQYVAEKSML